MSDSIKPCPFCGSENLSLSEPFVRCRSCGAYGPDAPDDMPSTGLKMWNDRQRPPPEPPVIKCEIGDGACPNNAVYEAWWRRRDPFLGTPTGHLVKLYICEEHKTHPFLVANEPPKAS